MDTDLSAIEAIRVVKASYGELTDRLGSGPQPGDEDALRAILAQDVEFQFGAGPDAPGLAGRDAAMAHFVKTIPGMVEWMWHGFHNPIITVSGDEAQGRWAFHAYSVAKGDPAEAITMTVGRTFDRYVREGGAWKMRRMEGNFNGQWPLAVRA